MASRVILAVLILAAYCCIAQAIIPKLGGGGSCEGGCSDNAGLPIPSLPGCGNILDIVGALSI